MSGLVRRTGHGREGGITGPEEVPHDPALPQLPTAFDPVAMREQFQSLPGFEGLVIEHCQLAYARYKPGMHCLIIYCLRVRAPSGAFGEQLLTGKIVATRPEQRAVKLPRKQGQPRYGPPYGYLPKVHMAVSAFPNDRSIRGLYHLWDPRTLKRILERGLPALRDGTWRLPARHVGMELVSYKPERSCLIVCHLKVRHPVTAERARWTLYGRMYKGTSGVEVYQAMRRLWVLKQAHGWKFGLAEPLAYDHDSRLLLQSQERGQLLTDCLGDPNYLASIARVATSVAQVHCSGVQVRRYTDALRDLRNFARLARAASTVHSPAHRLIAVIEELGRHSHCIHEVPGVLVHGDFTPDQILVEAQEITLLDFDWAAMGDPVLDVGSFSGSFRQLGADGTITPETAVTADATFCSAYARTHPVERFEERLRWHRALFLVKRSLEAIWLLQSGWREQMERYRQLAEMEL